MQIDMISFENMLRDAMIENARFDNKEFIVEISDWVKKISKFMISFENFEYKLSSSHIDVGDGINWIVVSLIDIPNENILVGDLLINGVRRGRLAGDRFSKLQK